MKKLFIQFYLLLFVCFLVMTMLVGLVYKVTAERAGSQSLDDLMKSSLYLMRSELREIPPYNWNKTLKDLDLSLSFELSIKPLSSFVMLDPPTMRRHRRTGSRIYVYSAHSAKSLCTRRWSGPLSLFSSPDAPAGYRTYRDFSGYSGIYLDPPTLAGYVALGNHSAASGQRKVGRTPQF